MSLLLGLDIGTASAKAVLVEPDGAIIARAVRPHRLSLPRPGWAEHDAEEVWWSAVCTLARELVSKAAGEQIAAVAVSGIGPCLLPCDASVRPLRPAILYGIDTRAGAEIDECVRRFGAETILRRGGSPLTSQAIGPKLLWLARHEPSVWEACAGWYTASSFALARLTGEYAIDHHTASQSDPLYDIEQHDWASDIVEELAGALPMPRLVDPDEVVGVITPAAAAQTGLAPGTPVVAGTIDACAEALSVGVREPGELMLMYGSTMFMIQIAGAARPHPGVWTTIAYAPPTRAVAAGMATSGSLTQWLSEVTGRGDLAALAVAAADVPAGARGLLALPYFAGERSPLFDPELRGAFVGLTLSHGPAELMRAAYEAIAFGVRHNLEVLAAAGGPPRRVVAVGGGTATTLWPRIVSSVTGVAQELPRERIGASYGDALLAARGVGLVSRAATWATITEVLTPEAREREVYEELFGLYRELGERLTPISHRLVRAELESSSASEQDPIGPRALGGVAAGGA